MPIKSKCIPTDSMATPQLIQNMKGVERKTSRGLEQIKILSRNLKPSTLRPISYTALALAQIHLRDSKLSLQRMVGRAAVEVSFLDDVASF